VGISGILPGKMSGKRNVDVVRRTVEAFPRGVEEMLSSVDPEIELHSAIVGGAEGNVYRWPRGVSPVVR
jgi:hypothetical protein